MLYCQDKYQFDLFSSKASDEDPTLKHDFADDENIRRIQTLVMVYNNNGEIRFWKSIKTDIDCRIMINSCEKIVMMVVIAYICCLVIVFVCLVV